MVNLQRKAGIGGPGCGTMLAMELSCWVLLGIAALFLDQAQMILLFGVGLPVSGVLVLVVHTLLRKRRHQDAMTGERPSDSASD